MKKPIKCDLTLLHLLKKVEKKHIDYLVDVLTDHGNGRIALSSSIKDLLITEKSEPNYTEECLRYILNEFQEYGGHSLVNIFRSEPIPYSELLTDVHKKLNGTDSKRKSCSQKEHEIVLSLFGNEWQNLEEHDRLERCTERKVIYGFFEMDKHLNFDEKGFLIGLSTAASAAAFLAFRMFPATAIVSTLGLAGQSVGEAYRLTVPFVAHVAMLKMLHNID